LFFDDIPKGCVCAIIFEHKVGRKTFSVNAVSRSSWSIILSFNESLTYRLPIHLTGKGRGDAENKASLHILLAGVSDKACVRLSLHSYFL